MLTHHLLAFYRSITRHRLYAALSVLTLALGMAVFIVLGLLLRFETSFDRWVPHADQVFRLSASYREPHDGAEGGKESFATAPRPALAAVAADFPKVAAGADLIDDWEGVSSPIHNENQRVFYADANLFDVLALPLAAGDPRTALARPDDIVIREDLARAYFGAANPLGRELQVAEDYGPTSFRRLTYHVSAVLRTPPANSDLDIPIIVPFAARLAPQMPDLWSLTGFHTFLRLRSAVDGAALNRALPQIVARHAYGPGMPAGMTVRLTADPLPALHFADAGRAEGIAPGADGRIFYSLGAVAVLALVIAVLNFVNLTTARSAARVREIALRKVLGATRGALMLQFLLESISYAAVAALISLAMVELALPEIDRTGGYPLRLDYWGVDGVAPWLAGLALLIGLAGGLYPALRRSRLEPAAVLAAARHPGGGRPEARVRAVLIAIQFAAAVVSIICTLVISAQASFLHADDRGFRRGDLLLMYEVNRSEAAQRRPAILAAFRHTPGVISVTTSGATPGLPAGRMAAFQRPGSPGSDFWFAIDRVGDDYLQTYGARLLAGRMLDRADPNDDLAADQLDRDGLNVVINARAAHALGFATPQAAIGARLIRTSYDPRHPSTALSLSDPIVGVIQDIDFGSPRQAAEPEVYFYSSQELGSATIRYAGVGEAEMTARLKAAWDRTAPGLYFFDKSVEAALSPYFQPEAQTARLFALGSGLAVLISVLGLYGLASFNIERRFKEMCLRKTLGASSVDVLRLLLRDMLWPVIIAGFVAWPLAYLAMHGWLASFSQRIPLSPLYFLAATGLCCLIAALTVLAQSIRLSWSQPAEALRHE